MFTRTLALLALISEALASQVPLTPSLNVNASTSKTWTSQFFTPLESLSYVKDSGFSVLGHPFFPKHSVRIKKSDFCDSTVNAYTGYIDIEARHLFFYFFESRSDPDKDDVIFWTNGGPGCSSSLGLFMELGPCRVLDDDGPKFHPESWNTNANVFFIDQPIGVGFSYAEYGESVSTTEEAAKDVAAFVAIFFENFSRFKGRGFHMAGESYGGRYLPLFASAVYDQNSALIEAGITPINLTSVMIGNGMTDFYTMKVIPRCQKWLPSNFCNTMLYSPFEATGMNPYDISVPCNGSIEETLCYPVTVSISNFLSQPPIRAQLGVDTHPEIPVNFSACNPNVGAAFDGTQDILHSSRDYVTALLEREVRVLIYVGSYDWICNWVGNEQWSRELEWSGQEEFASQELREWMLAGKKAGITRSARGGLFTFATVQGAGHMVPYNKPKEALALVQRWIAREEL
ncbi:serine carboxypeptidase [Lentinula edodes]|uniref:Carboxypeptidase n=1 Tax=Lentinula edodes TaxID=5353 RepID=A0A1Q3EJE1_LENED|nr:serine carboxypeptidase [Lentinula edodes]